MSVKPTEEKIFFVKWLGLVVGRKLDNGTEKILLKMDGLEYPNCTRLDMVAIQDVFTQALQKLVDLGYESVKATKTELPEFVESVKMTIRGCEK